MSKPTLLEDLTEFEKRLDALLADNAHLRAERDCLVERLRGSPELREIVVELRAIVGGMNDGLDGMVQRRLERLLRRLDESQ